MFRRARSPMEILRGRASASVLREGAFAFAFLLAPFALGQAILSMGWLGEGWSARWGYWGGWLAAQGAWGCLLSGICVWAFSFGPVPERPANECGCSECQRWAPVANPPPGAFWIAAAGIAMLVSAPARFAIGDWAGAALPALEASALALSVLSLAVWGGFGFVAAASVRERWARDRSDREILWALGRMEPKERCGLESESIASACSAPKASGKPRRSL